ncbi:hypothetical protein GLOIN_2v1504592, partial [Rhizophagus irregularis DAOM 181602=DAOM 197198]
MDLGSSFIQFPSSCLIYFAIPSIQVTEYTFANPPSPICFVSLNQSNGNPFKKYWTIFTIT